MITGIIKKPKELVYWLVITAIFFLLTVITDMLDRHAAYGDGAEYQAMLIAFEESGRPWMDDTSWSFFEREQQEGTLTGYPSREWLEYHFSSLKKSGKQDFPHFWFYSAMAWIVWKPFAWTGLDTTYAFFLLHGLLFLGAGIIVRNLFGWKGFGIYIFLICVSPCFWYINKVHTEFFTISISIAGVALLMKSRYICAALCFAVLSTQNPPFALPALLALLPYLRQPFIRRFNLIEIAGFAFVGLLISLHPLYYIIRHGAITPQLVTKAASLGETSTGVFWIPILDLNLGLFPNWPVLTLLTACALGLAVRNRKFPPLALTVFCTISCIFLLYASAKTSNINHGMTVSLSRYALWHIWIFFPILLWLTENFEIRHKITRLVFLAILTGLGILQITTYFPTRPAKWAEHNLIAASVLKYLPGLYNPHPSIFHTRTIGNVYWRNKNTWAVVYGEKWLVHPNRMKLPASPAPPGLFYPHVNVQIDTVKLRQAFDMERQSKGHLYFNLPPKELEKFVILDGPIPYQGSLDLYFNTSEVDTMLAGEWHQREAKFRWTGRHAYVHIAGLPRKQLKVELDVQSFGGKPFEIYWNDKRVLEHKVGSGGTLFFRLDSPEVEDRNILEISCPEATSPIKLGQSLDPRILGLAVAKIRITPEES
ncbi:MAG: hypothetical protein AB3N33_06585 [Puniceicoccaceae bacterium]